MRFLHHASLESSAEIAKPNFGEDVSSQILSYASGAMVRLEVRQQSFGCCRVAIWNLGCVI